MKLVNVVAWIGYYLGLDSLFYWLNRKSKRILTFHNVIPDDLLPSGERSCTCCSLSDFLRVIREVAKRYRFSTDVTDVSSATITFDDGYLNQYEIAFKALREEGDLPAILFVSLDLIGSCEPRTALVVDQLFAWNNHAPLDIAEKFFAARIRDRGQLWTEIIRPRFVRDVSSRGRDLLSSLNAGYEMGKIFDKLPKEYVRIRFQGISGHQLKDLREHGWLVGHHTRSHFPLSALGQEDAKLEMCPPSDEFKDIPFGFPYGEEFSVSAKDIALAKELGYPCAVSNLVESPSYCGRYFMPRFMLSSDKYLLHFELSGFKHFLKSRKLLWRGCGG